MDEIDSQALTGTRFARGTKDAKFKEPLTPGTSRLRSNKTEYPSGLHTIFRTCVAKDDAIFKFPDGAIGAPDSTHSADTSVPGLGHLSAHFVTNPRSVLEVCGMGSSWEHRHNC